MMSVDFDASDPPPATKQQIEDTDPRVDGMPCENIRLPLRSQDMHSLCRELYVRPGGLPGSSDIKTYDAGNFNIATQGCQNNSEIGELRVRYNVTFSVPVLDSTTTVSPNRNVSIFANAVSQGFAAGVPEIASLATTLINGIGATSVGGSVTLPAGNYLADWSWVHQDSANESTACVVQFKKNGTGIGILRQMDLGPSINGPEGMMSQSTYVTSDGNDVFDLTITVSGLIGTLTGYGELRFVVV